MDRKIRALIADDEPVARDSLRMLLTREADVEVVGETFGERTVADVLSLRPDVMFLDVEMPGLDGFEVLARLPADALPLVVFVTAYDEYATRAFDQRALDYLLKPYSDARFAESLRRAKAALQDGQAIAEHRRAVERLATQWIERPIVIVDGGKQFIFRPREILYVKASGVYAEITTRRGRTLARTSLTSLEERLGPGRFFRVHRSTLVNLDHAIELRTVAHGDGELVLHDGAIIPVSRSRRSSLERALARGR